MSKKIHISLLTIILFGISTNGVQFERMKFNQDIDVNAVETINGSLASTNGTTIIGASQEDV